MRKKLLLGSAIPARALYLARVSNALHRWRIVLPGEECGHKTKGATSLDASRVGLNAAVVEVANAEHQESQVQGEEEGKEGNS